MPAQKASHYPAKAGGDPLLSPACIVGTEPNMTLDTRLGEALDQRDAEHFDAAAAKREAIEAARRAVQWVRPPTRHTPV